MPDEMRPEPAVIFEVKASDWLEHASLLSNPEANALADDAAVEQARSLGLTEEEIALLRTPEVLSSAPQASEVRKTLKMSSARRSTGRIAERIVANELEHNGFLVRDLNLEGLAANVDLLAVKDGKMWQIQVKGSSYDQQYLENGWWFQYGYCKSEHIAERHTPMFNRVSSSFRADLAVLVCVKSPREYRCIVLPIDRAEEAAQINLDYAYRTRKKDGTAKKPSVVWTSFYVPEKTSDEKKQEIRREQDLIRPFEDKWDFDIAVAPSGTVQAVVNEGPVTADLRTELDTGAF